MEHGALNFKLFFLRLNLFRPRTVLKAEAKRGRIFLSLSLSLSLFFSYSQSSISINNTQALIGDQLELTLQVNVPSSQDWINPDVVPADTVSSIEVINTGDVQQSASGGYTQYMKKWTIAVFDTGIVRIPPVPVILESSLDTDTQYTNDIPLLISGVTDSLGLAPIKPILREPAKLSDYMPYILGVAGLALLILVVILLRRRKPKEKEFVVIRDEKPAHVIALEALDALEREKLWQQGLIKEYHSGMNHIMRAYLERRYRIPALESTSNEIMVQLRGLDLQEELLKKIREVMEVEDLIKFAKAEPPVDIHAQYLEFARTLILQTKAEPLTTPADA